MKARFSKVSQQQYLNARNCDSALTEYNEVKLPCRATRCSAGYDFFAPFDFVLQCGQSIVVPTAMRCVMPDDWV